MSHSVHKCHANRHGCEGTGAYKTSAMAPLVMSRGGTGQRPDWTSWCGVQVHSHRMHLSRLVPSLSRIPVRASMGMIYLELELVKTSSARMECELLDFLSVQQKRRREYLYSQNIISKILPHHWNIMRIFRPRVSFYSLECTTWMLLFSHVSLMVIFVRLPVVSKYFKKTCYIL